MSLVLDSSVSLAWFYAEEATEKTDEVAKLLAQSGAWVPPLWKLEIANILESGIRRGRNDISFRDQALTDLALMPINIDAETAVHAWSRTLALAHQHKLTVYDAAYLELALRRSLPLATLDKDLRKAAHKEKVILLGQ
ncbi:type II toxin-antitoxin system VapC family toxin [Silvibacterium acidisoli]|uniref:type II toxin-antitoxin system VapC family toxin n=1 Tax=Acidobacteriaceae bacterium ZG23-2 TaxID=2883246 RepID=UPI00406D379D